MTIATVTLNAAIDRAMYFRSEFRAGQLNRAYRTVTTVGGKGINVSRVAAVLGASSPAYGFIGGTDGEYIERILRADGIDTRFTSTAAPTRVNIKMIDGGGVCTEANESGGPISENEMFELVARIRSDIKSELSTENEQDFDSFFVLGGSIPQGVDNSVYKYLGQLLKSCGKRFVIDSSGIPLELGIESSPFMIKPNLAELSALCKTEISTKAQAVDYCRRVYVESGIAVLCTAGGEGAIYAGGEGLYTVNSPQVTLRGFVGAGDTFLSAFLYKFSTTRDISQALSFASSAAAAKVELSGTQIPQSEDQMQKYQPQLSVCDLGSI